MVMKMMLARHVPPKRQLPLSRWSRARIQRVAAHARAELNRVAGAAERHAPESASLVVERLQRLQPRSPAGRKHRRHDSDRDR